LAVGDVTTSTFLLEPSEGRVPVRWDGSQVQLSAAGRGFTAGAPAIGEYALAWKRDGGALAALIDTKLATIQCLALANEWGWLAAGRRDGSISVWDVSKLVGADDAGP
jgi:hypothetical protein